MGPLGPWLYVPVLLARARHPPPVTSCGRPPPAACGLSDGISWSAGSGAPLVARVTRQASEGMEGVPSAPFYSHRGAGTGRRGGRTVKGPGIKCAACTSSLDACVALRLLLTRCGSCVLDRGGPSCIERNLLWWAAPSYSLQRPARTAFLIYSDMQRAR